MKAGRNGIRPSMEGPALSGREPHPSLRVVLIAEMIQPYRVPVFNQLALQPDLDFWVLFLSLREKNRQWEVPLEHCHFRYQVLDGYEIYLRALDWGLHFTRGLTKTLTQLQPDVVIGTGYVSPAYVLAQALAQRKGWGYVLWSGSTLATSRIGKGPLRWMKKWFVKRCQAYLSYGTAATQALLALGAEESRIVTSRNTVDIHTIRELTETARHSETFTSFRQRFPPQVILYVGQMIDRKGVRELIHAFQAIDHPDLGLILIGEGPEKARYMQATTGMTRIFWEGYLQTSQMGPYFACADVLVMPSYLEPWGLVVNEAMAAGLPVIATTCSGATTDLLQEGITGHAIAAGDVNRLVTLLYSVLQEPDRWRQMGRQAAVKIQEASPARYAADFAAACRLAVAPRPR